MLDNYNRRIDYLRISVTDRCNLRCTYCMPDEMMHFVPRSEILSYEELLKLIEIFSEIGIRKVRFTGGEPFVRKDFIYFLKSVRKFKQIEEIHITTNGVLAGNYLDELKKIGISGLNISLDTINRDTFKLISLRDNLEDVLDTIKNAQVLNIPVKINMVVMEKVNQDGIFPMIDFFKDDPIELRFIEYMPFNERDDHLIEWTADKIIESIKSNYSIKPLIHANSSTSEIFSIEDFPLKIGVIAGYSRTFCGSCNRIRLNATGEMKTCLYGDSRLNLRDEMRQGKTHGEIKNRIINQIENRDLNGFQAEKNRKSSLLESMSKIGG